jgi:hypothetical protein
MADDICIPPKTYIFVSRPLPDWYFSLTLKSVISQHATWSRRTLLLVTSVPVDVYHISQQGWIPTSRKLHLNYLLYYLYCHSRLTLWILRLIQKKTRGMVLSSKQSMKYASMLWLTAMASRRKSPRTINEPHQQSVELIIGVQRGV